MTLPENAICPECQAEPTEDSIIKQRLSDVGYYHEDTRLECSECGFNWVIGEPKGEPERDTWVCDACEGDLIPHFLYLAVQEGEITCRPKCKSCNWVPDERITLDTSRNGDNITAFIGHHTVTGSPDSS